jgi:hypothetical protein
MRIAVESKRGMRTTKAALTHYGGLMPSTCPICGQPRHAGDIPTELGRRHFRHASCGPGTAPWLRFAYPWLSLRDLAWLVSTLTRPSQKGGYHVQSLSL